jgi:hypothetical protein
LEVNTERLDIALVRTAAKPLRVKIVYLGRMESPKGNTYKDFAVAVWEERE